MRLLSSDHAWQTAARAARIGLTPSHSSSRILFPHVTLPSRRCLFNWAGSSVKLPEVQRGEGSRNLPFLLHIPSQDYLSRIRMMPPAMNQYDVEVLDRRMRSRNKEEQGVFSVHCLPFWTMLYLSHTASSLLNKQTGETRADEEMICDFGFTVAAVSKNHWAYGTISYYHPRLLFAAVQGDHWHDAMPNSNTFNQIHETNLQFPSSNYTPFEIGYPVLNKQEHCEIWRAEHKLSSITEDSQIYEVTKNWTLLPDLAKPTITFAVPMYRLVVRAQYPWGDYLWDASHRRYFAGDNLDLIGDIDLSHSSGYKMAIEASKHNFPVRFVHYTMETTYKRAGQNKWAVSDPIPTAFALTRGDWKGEMIIAKQIVSALDRSPPVDWKDPNILPADRQPGETLAGLIKYAGNRIMRIPTGPLPQAFQAETPAARPLSSELRSSNLSVLRSSSLARPVRPAPKSSQTATTSPPSASPKSPSPPPTSPPKPARPRAPPPPRPTVKKPVKVALRISDPTGYYSVLEIDPTTEFIEQATDKAATKQLNDARRALLAMYHPDRSYSNKDHKDGMSAKYQAVMDAHEALNTVEKRIRYSGRK